MAHKEYKLLVRLIQYFSKDCIIFIHVDKRNFFLNEEIQSFKALPNVFGVYSKYTIHWGGFSMLQCEMYMLKKVMESCRADYVHLFSGQDYPIKPLSTFLNFFEEHKGMSFISYVHLPHPKWQNNTYSRFDYFYPYDWIEWGSRSSTFIDRFVKWQKRIGLKRSIPAPFEHLYGGSQWFSATHDSIKVLLDYTKKNKSFYNRLRFTFAPEECYIPTVLVNLLPKGSVFPRNYRFIRWKFENNNIPSNLGVEHFHLLTQTDDLFARKFERSYCDKLLPLIDKYLTSEASLKILPNGAWDYNGFEKYRYDTLLAHDIASLCKKMNFTTVLDFGCGAGALVACLRRMGFLATGIDANPHTPKLSSLLLPKGDTPCQFLDITLDFIVEEQFDLVLCLDVLDCIHSSDINDVLHRIIDAAKACIIISIKKKDTIHKEQIEEFLSTSSIDFLYCRTISCLLMSQTNEYEYIVLERIYKHKNNHLCKRLKPIQEKNCAGQPQF